MANLRFENNLFVKTTILLVCSLFVSSLAEECVQKSPCLCEFPDYSFIDLTKLIDNPTDFLVASNENISIYYHGCTDGNLNNFTLITPLNYTECNDSLSVCMYNHKSQNLTKLGDAKTMQFMLKDDEEYVTYEINGKISNFKLICTSDKESNLLLHDNDEIKYNFRLYSPHACIKHIKEGLSAGSKLLIMFFTFAGIYFFGGACVSYFLRGARGKELIPNVDFWMNLPGLVKDGVIYVMSGCRPQMVTTADTYDQI